MKAQGFTLIELLAVIVILAIIALIATPIVLGIIEDTKESAMLRSAEMYLSGVENAVMRENLNQNGNFKPTECTITPEGNLYCEPEDVFLEIEVDGETPIDGSIKFEEGKIKEVQLIYQSGTIVKDPTGNLVYEGSSSNITYESLGNWEHKLSDGTIESHDTESGTCSKCGENVLAPGLYKPDGTFVSWEQLTDINHQSVIYVDTMGNGYNSSIITIGQNGMKSGYDYFIRGYNTSSEYLVGKLVIDSSVTNFDTFALGDCRNLTSVEFSDGTTILNTGLLSCCTSLESIKIPKSVIELKNMAIWACSNLSEIHYGGTMAEWNNIEFETLWNEACPQITVHCTDGDLIIPEWTY